MSFTDKTIFNIRARQPLPIADVNSRNFSDDEYAFHQPFRTLAEATKLPQAKFYMEKVARLLQQAAANKVVQ